MDSFGLLLIKQIYIIILQCVTGIYNSEDMKFSLMLFLRFTRHPINPLPGGFPSLLPYSFTQADVLHPLLNWCWLLMGYLSLMSRYLLPQVWQAASPLRLLGRGENEPQVYEDRQLIGELNHAKNIDGGLCFRCRGWKAHVTPTGL